MHTSDGATWQAQASGTSQNLWAVDFAADARHGWAVGDDGTVVSTGDGGDHWVVQGLATSNQLTAVAALGPESATVTSGGGEILHLGPPPPHDTTLPTTSVAGSAGGWSRAPMTLWIKAGDPGGVALCEWQTAGAWRPGSALYVTGEGSHTLRYRALDNAGNLSAVKSVTVGIDTRRPATLALSPASVSQGGTVRLAYEVSDPRPGSPAAKVTIVIRTKAGRQVRRIVPGWQRVGVPRTCAYRCGLPPGRYEFFVYATDAAGNRQATIGSSTLSVN